MFLENHKNKRQVKKKTLSQKQITDYLNVSYGQCPRCKSTHISGDSIDIDSNTATQDVTCSDCELGWTDIYTLTSIEIDPATLHNQEETTNESRKSKGKGGSKGE